MVKKITKEEYNKIKEDVKSGKISLDKLYRKAGVYPPYMMPYEYRPSKDKDKTREEYAEVLINAEIDFVLSFIYSTGEPKGEPPAGYE